MYSSVIHFLVSLSTLLGFFFGSLSTLAPSYLSSGSSSANNTVEASVQEFDESVVNPQIILMGATPAPGRNWICNGVSVSKNQVLTSRHCTDQLERTTDLVVVGHEGVTAAEIQNLDNADMSIVTLDAPINGNNGCTNLFSQSIAVGEELSLFTFDAQTGALSRRTLTVSNSQYSAFNPEIGQVLNNLILASRNDGPPTEDGQSGAPVLAIESDGRYALAGILQGISEATGEEVIQPIYTSIDQIHRFTPQCLK